MRGPRPSRFYAASFGRSVRWRAAVVALAAAAALVPLSPGAIERVYSSGILPRVAVVDDRRLERDD